MSAEDIWRRKSDHELLLASQRLDEYTEDGRRVIQAELERRRSPEYVLAQQDAQERARSATEQPRTKMDSPRISGNQTAWVIRRALLAIGLMIGFYVFAAVIAVGLLWVPYAEWTYVGRLDIKIAAVCLGAGLTILWALVPRADRFIPPGPRLDESRHPKLFEVIRQVATATGQTAPADVYLLNEVNAWVSHRGGTMGFGSHQVMGIGLPLLQALSVSEFRAIIAHEFGHYASSDVKLGPWIYKTRAAIGRAIVGVHETFVEAPFVWYGNQFLKLTHAVSRQQEFVADRVAARVAGTPALAHALRRTTSLASAFSEYVGREVNPVLQAGFLPPISAGFDAFLRSDAVVEASRRIIEHTEAHGQTELFDTHPSLRDRLAALESTERDGGAEDNSEPAAHLIGDVNRHANAILEFALGSDSLKKLKPIEWSAVGDAVFAPRWQAVRKHYSPWLGRFTVNTLPNGKRAFILAGSDLVHDGEQNVDSQQRIERAVFVLGAGIGVLLLEDGWRAVTAPGQPVLLMRESAVFDPLGAVRALAEGATTSEAWIAQCTVLGIGSRPLADGTAPPVTAKRPVIATVTRAPERKRAEIDEISCYACKAALRVTAETRGKTVKCPKCGTKQSLPR